jgi:hypothetical protein
MAILLDGGEFEFGQKGEVYVGIIEVSKLQEKAGSSVRLQLQLRAGEWNRVDDDVDHVIVSEFHHVGYSLLMIDSRNMDLETCLKWYEAWL